MSKKSLTPLQSNKLTTYDKYKTCHWDEISLIYDTKLIINMSLEDGRRHYM